MRVSDRADKPIKSLMKSVSWRIVGTIDTMIISYFITGKVTIALSIGSVEVLNQRQFFTIFTKDYGLIFIKLDMIRFIKSNGKKYEVKGVE